MTDEMWAMLDKIAAILAGVLILVMLSSCGEADGDTGAAAPTFELTPTATLVSSPTPLPTETPAAAPTETPLPSPSPTAREPRHDDLPRPPDATLTAGDASQTGKLGTYCWTGDEGGACVDMIGILVPEETLEVEPGQRLAFRVEGIDALANVEVQAFDFASVQNDHGNLVLMYPFESEVEVPVDLSGEEIVITADLPPGEHVISVFLGFPDDESLITGVDHQVGVVRGDATYGFHIQVVGA